jgi:hypothetical protein
MNSCNIIHVVDLGCHYPGELISEMVKFPIESTWETIM